MEKADLAQSTARDGGGGFLEEIFPVLGIIVLSIGSACPRVTHRLAITPVASAPARKRTELK